MKSISLIVLFSIISLTSMSLLAQKSTFIQRLSLEAGGGYNINESPDSQNSTKNYSGFRNFNLGANYLLNDYVGLRFTYGNRSFRDKEDSAMGLTLHKLLAEGTLNIVQLIEMLENPFEVIAHGGAGISLGKSKVDPRTDKMITFQAGIMPMIKILKNVSIYFDASYVINILQDFYYDGVDLTTGKDSVNGEYFMLNFGIRVSF